MSSKYFGKGNETSNKATSEDIPQHVHEQTSPSAITPFTQFGPPQTPDDIPHLDQSTDTNGHQPESSAPDTSSPPHDHGKGKGNNKDDASKKEDESDGAVDTGEEDEDEDDEEKSKISLSWQWTKSRIRMILLHLSMKRGVTGK